MPKLSASLSIRSLNALRAKLADIPTSWDIKVEKFVEALADKGISIAQANTGGYSDVIGFQKTIHGSNGSYIATIIAQDTQAVMRSWKYKNGIKTVQINATAMAEFGSGFEANIKVENGDGYGQGTFPGQTNAFNPYGWFWTDLDGVKHHSKGEKPTYPMYSAVIGMLMEINSIAKASFK